MPSKASREPVEWSPHDFPSCLTGPACNAWVVLFLLGSCPWHGWDSSQIRYCLTCVRLCFFAWGSKGLSGQRSFFCQKDPASGLAQTLLKHIILGKDQVGCFPISTRNYTSSFYHVNFTRQCSFQEINAW